MAERFRDAGTTIYEFGEVFLVRCPRCSRRASVVRAAPSGTAPASRGIFGPRRCVCAHCGYIQDWTGGSVCIGGPRDWFFDLPLWLQMPCCGHTLWACNEDHLAFLERFVAATIRERMPGLMGNRSLASRLPRWMQASSNRAEVLCGLERLRALLA
jgi:hypothetical protein